MWGRHNLSSFAGASQRCPPLHPPLLVRSADTSGRVAGDGRAVLLAAGPLPPLPDHLPAPAWTRGKCRRPASCAAGARWCPPSSPRPSRKVRGHAGGCRPCPARWFSGARWRPPFPPRHHCPAGIFVGGHCRRFRAAWPAAASARNPPIAPADLLAVARVGGANLARAAWPALAGAPFRGLWPSLWS